MLSGVKFQLNSMKGNVILSEENAETFTRSIAQLDNAITEMRRVAHNMMPEALLKFGLNDTLKNYCESVSQNSGLAVTFQSYGLENRLDQSTEIVLYRIVQELLNNTVKHALATQAQVQLSRIENRITLTVEDNGKGFDVNNLSGKGIGLSNIQNRVDYLNGKMDIKSDDKGTSTHIEFEMI
jgi:signal transduction histidine kinase